MMTSVEIAAELRGAIASETQRTHIETAAAAGFGAGHEVLLIRGAQEIAAALKQHRANHPVHEFDFSLARLKFRSAEKYVALIKGPAGGTLGAVPVLRHDGEILLLNNYILLPEDAMAALLTALMDRFNPNNIRTQRNYNNYSIFGKKTEMTDGFLATFDGGFEPYFQSLGKKTKFNVRYYHDRLRASFPSLETEFVAAGKLQPELFAEFIELVGKRYDKSYWTGFLKEEIFAKFRDCVTCTIVRAEGRIAAFNIFFVFGDTLIFTGNTFDEAYSKYSLGFLTTFWSIQHAAKQGFTKVILGPGDFGYKARLSNAKETLYQYSLS
jgi:hypothetical protein